MHWREFFRWTLAKHGGQLFQLEGLLGRDDRPTARHAEIIDAWQQGRSGTPFVDANMRELKEIGYMSNRGRQNVASNRGNWANVAGAGTDKRDRSFNVLAQAWRYDADASYISQRMPELKAFTVDQRQVPFLLIGKSLLVLIIRS